MYSGSDVRLSIEFDPWDPDGNHIRLNIGGNIVSAAKSYNSSLRGPGPTYVWITHDAQEKALSVYVSQHAIRPDIPVLQYYFSL